MRAKEFITEGRNHPVIVVDIQPEYRGENDVCQKVVDFVQHQTGPVLMFINAETSGQSGDTVNSVRDWWEEMAGAEYHEDSGTYFSVIDWSRFTIVDKGYGYFSAWMHANEEEITPAVIIATIREMYRQGVDRSSRLKFPPIEQCNDQQKAIVKAVEIMGRASLYTNWTSIAQLKRFNGAYLVGGGRDDCLREVELLMNAFNIKYKRIDSLVY